jgi:hypothetical protein
VILVSAEMKGVTMFVNLSLFKSQLGEIEESSKDRETPILNGFASVPIVRRKV